MAQNKLSHQPTSEHTIYLSPKKGVRAVLTTLAPGSRYGFPVLRIEGTELPDYGPADLLPTGFFASQMVKHCVEGSIPEGFGGRIPQLKQAAIEAARRFCSQWPDGPQIGGGQ